MLKDKEYYENIVEAFEYYESVVDHWRVKIESLKKSNVENLYEFKKARQRKMMEEGLEFMTSLNNPNTNFEDRIKEGVDCIVVALTLESNPSFHDFQFKDSEEVALFIFNQVFGGKGHTWQTCEQVEFLYAAARQILLKFLSTPNLEYNSWELKCRWLHELFSERFARYEKYVRSLSGPGPYPKN